MADAMRVIIVEDVAMVARSLEGGLTRNGCLVVGIFADAATAIAAAETLMPDVVLMDIVLAGAMDGIVAAEEIYVCIATPVVLLSGSDDPAVIDRAERAGVYGFVKKPCGIAPLVSALRLAIAKHAEVKSAKGLCGMQRIALEYTSAPIIVTDGARKIVLINRAATALLGCRRWDAVAHDLSELLDLSRFPAELATERGATTVASQPERSVSFVVNTSSLDAQSFLVWTLDAR